MRRQDLHRFAAHKRSPVAATPHLVVDLQNNLGFVRDLDCSILDLRPEESRRVVLDCCWQNMAGGEHRCTELGHGLAVVPLLPSPFRGRVRDQGGDVGVP